jgi:hypothetical protein
MEILFYVSQAQETNHSHIVPEQKKKNIILPRRLVLHQDGLLDDNIKHIG